MRAEAHVAKFHFIASFSFIIFYLKVSRGHSLRGAGILLAANPVSHVHKNQAKHGWSPTKILLPGGEGQKQRDSTVWALTHLRPWNAPSCSSSSVIGRKRRHRSQHSSIPGKLRCHTRSVRGMRLISLPESIWYPVEVMNRWKRCTQNDQLLILLFWDAHLQDNVEPP